MKVHTKKFKDWIEELLSEDEGQSIARNKGLIGLELLYEKCTNKKAFKIMNISTAKECLKI